jgi:hypothetical protein
MNVCKHTTLDPSPFLMQHGFFAFRVGFSCRPVSACSADSLSGGWAWLAGLELEKKNVVKGRACHYVPVLGLLLSPVSNRERWRSWRGFVSWRRCLTELQGNRVWP